MDSNPGLLQQQQQQQQRELQTAVSGFETIPGSA
jgi:hypothetical protein